MENDPDLDAAYALETPDDNRRLYADWAETYDSGFVASHGYILHRQVVQAFAKAGGTGPVLDLGAGTGLCGEALAAAQIGPCDATDISPDMLQQAKAKGVYEKLFEGDILAGLSAKSGSYAGIVSAGTFTLGHVGPEGLDEVVRLLSPGGLAVISVRDTHFEQAGFATKLETLGPHIARSKTLQVPIYDTANGDYADDEAMLLHLWKA